MIFCVDSMFFPSIRVTRTSLGPQSTSISPFADDSVQPSTVLYFSGYLADFRRERETSWVRVALSLLATNASATGRLPGTSADEAPAMVGKMRNARAKKKQNKTIKQQSITSH